MKTNTIHISVKYDDHDPSDIHPAHIVSSIQKHLRTTGHPALKTAQVALVTEGQLRRDD